MLINSFFSFCAAGEAQIDMIDKVRPGNDVLISVAGPGRTSALGDGGTIMNDGLHIPVRCGNCQYSSIRDADNQLQYIAVKGKKDGNIPKCAGTKLNDTVITVLDTKRGDVGSDILADSSVIPI